MAKETATYFLFSESAEWRRNRNYWFGLAGVKEPTLGDVAVIVVNYKVHPRKGRGSSDGST